MIDVTVGMELVEDLNSTIIEIKENLTKTVAIGEETILMTEEQIRSSHLVTEAVNVVNEMSQVSADSSENIARTINMMKVESENLKYVINKYQDAEKTPVPETQVSSEEQSG